MNQKSFNIVTGIDKWLLKVIAKTKNIHDMNKKHEITFRNEKKKKK